MGEWGSGWGSCDPPHIQDVQADEHSAIFKSSGSQVAKGRRQQGVRGLYRPGSTCDLAPILILRLELCVTALREHKRGWKVHPSWVATGQQGQSAALHASNVPLTLAGTLQGRDCWPHFRERKNEAKRCGRTHSRSLSTEIQVYVPQPMVFPFWLLVFAGHAVYQGCLALHPVLVSWLCPVVHL